MRDGNIAKVPYSSIGCVDKRSWNDTAMVEIAHVCVRMGGVCIKYYQIFKSSGSARIQHARRWKVDKHLETMLQGIVEVSLSVQFVCYGISSRDHKQCKFCQHCHDNVYCGEGRAAGQVTLVLAVHVTHSVAHRSSSSHFVYISMTSTR